ARGLFVVVARADVHVARHLLAFLPNNHQHLGVGLVFTHAINDEAACLFEPRALPNIALLIEARLHLKQHRHVLAIFGGFEQRGRSRRPRRVGSAALLARAAWPLCPGRRGSEESG
nr:hypothetical protein [Tanacetum cinerariifolium]